MFNELVRRWWIVAARGTVSVIFGIAAFVAPEQTLTWLITLFALFALSDGIFTAGAGLAVNWMPLYLEGFVGIAVGLVTYFAPMSFVEYWLPVNIALYAIVIGGLELAGAIGLRPKAHGPMIRGDRLLGANGIFSLAVGLVLILNTTMASGALIMLVGTYALVSGLLLLAFALNVRTWGTALNGSEAVAH